MDYATLRRRHVEDFQGLMGRVHLNVGDHSLGGRPTDERLKAMRDGHNGYAPSTGIASAREAASADFAAAERACPNRLPIGRLMMEAARELSPDGRHQTSDV